MLGLEYQRTAESYLEKLEAAMHDGQPSPRTCERLFEEFLAVVEAPAPDAEVRAAFHELAVLVELAEQLHVAFMRELADAIGRVARRAEKRDTSFYRVRRLGRLGRYPTLEFRSGKAWYVLRGGRPQLVTLNSAREESKWSYGTDVSDWTRHETRLAAALACTEWGGFTPYLGGHRHDFLVSSVAHVDAPARLAFMSAYLDLVEAIGSQPARYYGREQDDSTRPYEFGDFRAFRDRAQAFARKFLVSHQVLLRTARYHVKAGMLWQTNGIRDDAVASMFFALEGCLLLLQEIAGGRVDRLDRRLLRRMFDETYEHGSSLYDFIDDAMGWGGMRAQVVHPQLAQQHGWRPSVMADDYYEYSQVVRALLMYVVTGKTFTDYALKS